MGGQAARRAPDGGSPASRAGEGKLRRPSRPLTRSYSSPGEMQPMCRYGLSREPGGGSSASSTPVLREAVPSKPALEPLPRGALAAARQARRGLRPGEAAVRRDPAHRQAARQPQDPRCSQYARARPRAPHAPVRGEDAVVVASGGYELARWNDRDSRERPQRDAGFAAGSLEPLLPPVRVAADVLRNVDRVGAGTAGHLEGGLHRISPPDQQFRATLPKRLVEIAKRIEQEGDPVRGSAPAREQHLVEDEERDDIPAARGRGQRRVVANAQIPGEENDGDGHGRRG